MHRIPSSRLCALIGSLGIVLAAHAVAADNPLQAPPAAPLRSNFEGALWEVTAPAGGTASVSDSHLFINVPGGGNHNALGASDQAVRVMQPVGNQDFDISIKIDSEIVAASAGTSQGLMVWADDKNFITFALDTNGSSISLTVHTVNNGVVETSFDDAHFSEYQNPICLGLRKRGNDYFAYYSPDGVVWTQAASFANTHVMSQVGPFAGNYNSVPARAVPVAMAINWFAVR